MEILDEAAERSVWQDPPLGEGWALNHEPLDRPRTALDDDIGGGGFHPTLSHAHGCGAGNQAARTPDWKFVGTLDYRMPILGDYQLGFNAKGYVHVACRLCTGEEAV